MTWTDPCDYRTMLCGEVIDGSVVVCGQVVNSYSIVCNQKIYEKKAVTWTDPTD